MNDILGSIQQLTGSQSIDLLGIKINQLNEEKQQLQVRIKELEAKLKEAKNAFIAISEYWNRSENDKALSDALYIMIGIADKFLSQFESKPKSAESEIDKPKVTKPNVCLGCDGTGWNGIWLCLNCKGTGIVKPPNPKLINREGGE